MIRVLCVQSDKPIEDELRLVVARRGWQVSTAKDHADALLAFRMHPHDTVILGCTRRNTATAAEVCREIRRQDSNCGIIVISRYASTAERVAALEVGADEYLTVHFEIVELVSRIHALLRRGAGRNTLTEQKLGVREEVLEGGPLMASVTCASGCAKYDLTPLQQRILVRLLRNIGRAVPHEELWRDFRVRAHLSVPNIRMAISALRKRLGRDGIWIETAPNIGYGIGVARELAACHMRLPLRRVAVARVDIGHSVRSVHSPD